MNRNSKLEAEQGIRSLFDRLEAAVAEFNEWCSSRIVEAEVYQLPIFDSPDIPHQIEAVAASGGESISLARGAYGLFTRDKLQHPSTVYRLPGYLVVDGQPIRQINQINRLKNTLRDEIKALAPINSTRQLLCRRLFPGVAMLQVYRQIHCATRSLDSVRFTWSPVTVSTRTLDRTTAIEFIEEWLDSEPAQLNPALAEAAEIALTQLALFPASAPILKRKPVAPHPRVSEFYGKGQGAQKRMLHANLPLIVPIHCKKNDFYVKALNEYDATRKKRTRLDKKSCTSLLEGLGLYY